MYPIPLLLPFVFLSLTLLLLPFLVVGSILVVALAPRRTPTSLIVDLKFDFGISSNKFRGWPPGISQ